MTEKKIKNNMSSSCLTRRSKNKDLHADWMPDQVGHDRKEEQGRSMVEMLGVLAVVGVLSVGGIAGYTYAMNKHYANELLAGASERAVLVSAQILVGKTPSLNEFNNTTAGGTFGIVEEFSDGGFGLRVSGVKEVVCQNVIKATKDTSIFIAKDDNAEVLNEMSESDCSGDNNNFWFVYDDLGGNGANSDGDSTEGGTTEPVDPCANVDCENGLTCFYGECKCSTGLFMCGEQCCAEGTYCTQGADSSTYTCAEPTGECTKNSDCKDAEGNVDTTKYCDFNSGSCSGPTDGSCKDKGTLTSYTLELPAGDLTVYTSSGTMYWWDAQNLCAAHGKQMVTMSDLEIQDTGNNTDCYFDNSHPDYASNPCICSIGDSDCSQTTAAIYKIKTSGYMWLADNSKSSSCSARYIYLAAGRVHYSNRGGGLNRRYAFCR